MLPGSIFDKAARKAGGCSQAMEYTDRTGGRMKQDREYIRMKFYCDVYLALANHDSAGQDKATSWAKVAVRDFDREFPKPSTGPGEGDE